MLAASFFNFTMANEPMDADRQNVLDALRTTYWKAAHREICTMILFFGDVLDHGLRIENYLAIDYAGLECENFTKIFDLWRKFNLIWPLKTF